MIRRTSFSSRGAAAALSLFFVCLNALASGSSGSGAIPLTNGTPVVQDFNTLSNGTSPSTVLPSGWYLTELGTGAAADGAYAVGNGSSNAGGAYSFGAAGSADRALGSIGSGTVAPILYGAKFTNNGQGPITTLSISFTGEMWRRGSPTAPELLTFSYSTDATDLNTGTFTAFAPLNFNTPGAPCSTGTSVATDGNSAACRTAVSATITGLAINPGGVIWIRWSDSDTQGTDDALAIDDVSVTASISSDPTPPSVTSSISPNPAGPGQTITLAGTIHPGFNPLSTTYAVSCDLSAIGGSTGQVVPNDGSTFSFGYALPATTVPGVYPLACSIVDDRARSTKFAYSLVVLIPLNSACGADATPISAIQGTGATSPLTGRVVDVQAVVTGDFQSSSQLSGFYLQQPVPDANPATSEGIFVFHSFNPPTTNVNVAQGDLVRVRGTVAEFSSNTGAAVSQLTELSSVTSVQVCSSGNALPAPVEVTLPITDTSQWERYEGMLVKLNQQLVVTGNFSLGTFGQVDLAPGVLFQPTQTPGSAADWAAATDLVNRSRITLDDASTSSNANLNGGTVAPYPPPGLSNANTLRAGALVNPNGTGESTPLVGILDDRFGAYRIQPTGAVNFSNAPNPRPDTAAVAASAGGRLKIASANVLNFFTTLGSRGAQTADELAHQRSKVVAELSKTGGDVIGLSELQNFNDGNTSHAGNTYTNAAIADLTAALGVATGRNYQFIDTINPANLAAGNVVADNGTDAIRSGFVYDAATVVPVGKAALYYQNDTNRPSLAQTFRPTNGQGAETQTFTVVVNHFRSKGSACGAGNDDVYQGNCNGTRLLMANNVRNWLAGNPTSDPAGANRSYILVGDYNAYFGEDPIQSFLGSNGYTDLINLLIGPKAYSYNFGSQAGYLDHAIVNKAALPLVRSVVELHVNADEPTALEALDSSTKSALAQVAYYAPNEFAASDHDPFVIGFNPLAGDFTDDGVLDARDRQAILRARGQTGTQIVDRRMDLNGDGAIDQQDFLIWQQLFVHWTLQAH